MRATATELNKHPGKYINQSLKQPVIVERSPPCFGYGFV